MTRIAIALGIGLLSAGCGGVVAVTPYTSEAERAAVEQQCADLETPEAKAAERASGVAGLAIGLGRFECARPRVWVRTKADPRPRAPEEALLDTGPVPPVPTPEPAASPEEIARHRAEVEGLRQFLREQGHDPSFRPTSSSSSSSATR